MTQGLRIIQTRNETYCEAAKDTLLAAAEQGFEAVVVLGLRGGVIHPSHSANVSRLEMIGAIEAAKQTLWATD